MKSNGRSLLSSTACIGLALALNSSARAAEAGPYALVDLGPALTQDADLKEFPGAGSGGKVKFDPGVRMSAGGGYRFAEWFRAGGEMGFIYNDIDGVDGYVSHTPLLGNVEFRLPNRTPIVPFVGGGPGLSFTSIYIYEDNFDGGTFVDGWSSDTVFAWQLYGGFRWKLNDTMSLGAVYKYFEADSSTWDVDGTSQDIRFGKIRSHAVNVSFSADF